MEVVGWVLGEKEALIAAQPCRQAHTKRLERFEIDERLRFCSSVQRWESRHPTTRRNSFNGSGLRNSVDGEKLEKNTVMKKKPPPARNFGGSSLPMDWTPLVASKPMGLGQVRLPIERCGKDKDNGVYPRS
ncbi:unnamed protein product [Heligmosomoides polygyrus]|uniref:Uncharacterized protein n=1 Tax=Heligmosomoides polygyrus TaxID=6339 RepID=A0A183FGB8_HELPZ|nr:unnamed protein product [Heligmosomoides polygyrus]